MSEYIQTNSNLMFAKKHPTWSRVFGQWLVKSPNIDINQLEQSFLKLMEYKSLLKNDITVEFAKKLLSHDNNDSRDILEQFNDEIDKVLHQKQKQQLISSLKTEKYTNLFDEEVESEISTILDNKISVSALKNQFFNKMARYKSAPELLQALSQFKEKNIGWNREYYLNKIKEDDLNVEILEDQDGHMVIHVKDYSACASLGSQAWCIVSKSTTFDRYTKDLNRQVIAFNFNLPIEDNHSIIGFTCNLNGMAIHAYLKNDKRISKRIKENFKIYRKKKKFIDTLLKKMNDEEKFLFACKHELMDYVNTHINDKKIDPAINNNEAIRTAARLDQFAMVDRLMQDDRVDPSVCDNYPIQWASEYGNLEMIDRLLQDDRVDPSIQNNYIIKIAAIHGRIDIVNRLLKDDRVDPSVGNNIVLGRVAENGDLEMIDRLLKDGRIDPSDRDNLALMSASENGHIEIVKLLLEDERVDFSKLSTGLINHLLKNKKVCKKLNKI